MFLILVNELDEVNQFIYYLPDFMAVKAIPHDDGAREIDRFRFEKRD